MTKKNKISKKDLKKISGGETAQERQAYNLGETIGEDGYVPVNSQTEYNKVTGSTNSNILNYYSSGFAAGEKIVEGSDSEPEENTGGGWQCNN